MVLGHPLWLQAGVSYSSGEGRTGTPPVSGALGHPSAATSGAVREDSRGTPPLRPALPGPYTGTGGQCFQEPYCPRSGIIHEAPRHNLVGLSHPFLARQSCLFLGAMVLGHPLWLQAGVSYSSVYFPSCCFFLAAFLRLRASCPRSGPLATDHP